MISLTSDWLQIWTLRDGASPMSISARSLKSSGVESAGVNWRPFSAGRKKKRFRFLTGDPFCSCLVLSRSLALLPSFGGLGLGLRVGLADCMLPVWDLLYKHKIMWRSIFEWAQYLRDELNFIEYLTFMLPIILRKNDIFWGFRSEQDYLEVSVRRSTFCIYYDTLSRYCSRCSVLTSLEYLVEILRVFIFSEKQTKCGKDCHHCRLRKFEFSSPFPYLPRMSRQWFLDTCTILVEIFKKRKR